MSTSRWAAGITKAYAASAKPPLTQELVEQVGRLVAEALEPETAQDSPLSLLDGVNAALDRFEGEIRSVVGSRVSSLDDATGDVEMRYRSEAGQPLRAYGGQ